MSFATRSRLFATSFSPLAIVFALVLIAACGSDKKSITTVDQTADGNSSTDGNSTTAIKNSAYSTKMARQTTDDVQEQADFSESASTGTDDGGGVEPPEQHGHKHGFDMNTNPNMDYNHVMVAFQGNITLTGSRHGGAEVHGNCGIKVEPQHANQQPGPLGEQNFTIVLTSDTQRTLDNNDVIEIKTEPNVTISRMGSRLSGKITRSINGQVHRTLTSAKDPNADFNIVINHQGHIVVDTYDVAPSFLLKSRVINGVSTVTDASKNISSKVTFVGLTRGQPSKCFCPTGGEITQTVTKDGQTTTHSYKFGGTCGQSTVSVDGSAAVAAGANATAKAETPVSTTSSATASAQLHGSLTWENCVPTAADTSN